MKTSITTDRQKYRNLNRNPKATLFVLDPTNPYRTVEIRATVELSPDPDKALLPNHPLRLRPRPHPHAQEGLHGSAPDIAGQGLANPIGAILSGALIFDHFGLDEQAARLRKAVDAATGAGVLTRDIGGTATTDQVVTTVIENLAP